MNKTLVFLEQIRHNLEYADFNMIYHSISELGEIAFSTTVLSKGGYIERARINNDGEIFTQKNQISYISDPNVLNLQTEYGRANKPKQAVFYGSIGTPKIPNSFVSAYLESTPLIREFMASTIPKRTYFSNSVDKYEIFTVGRWKILEDIPILKILLPEESITVNDVIKETFPLEYEDSLTDECIQFFRNEFARTDVSKKHSYNYKISSAFVNCMWHLSDSNIKAVLYPSVATGNHGQNVAMLPEIVDKHLKLESVHMFRFEEGETPDKCQFRKIKDLEDFDIL